MDKINDEEDIKRTLAFIQQESADFVNEHVQKVPKTLSFRYLSKQEVTEAVGEKSSFRPSSNN